MHDSTMIEPSYVSGGARELKASCWPANRGCATSEERETTQRTRGQDRSSDRGGTLSGVFGNF